ncbi:hypothetical protein KY285_034843 [Solanum tuberosum]|nr:hypothetical protein KY285_034843 [Solanum tuberosum]
MAHINGLVVAKVICSPVKFAIVVTCATQFMGGQVYVFIVLDKSFSVFEDLDNEQHLFVDIVKIILVHMLFFGTIAQFGLATIGGDCTTKIILDSNLEDKVLIEDGSIVMNQSKPRVDTDRDVTQATIGLRNRAKRPLQRLIWDLGPISN